MSHFENIVNMHPDCAVALTEAASRGGRFRIATGKDNDGDTWVKWDAGSGWTPPYFEQDAQGKPHFPQNIHRTHCGHDECHQHQRCIYV